MKTKIKLQSALIIIATCFGVNVFSQELYINADAGYGFPAAPYLMAENSTSNTIETNTTYDYEIVKGSGSFGKGVHAGAIIGYMLTENIGAELGIGYLFGGKITSTHDYHGDNNSGTSESTLSAKMLRFIPALKVTVGNGNIKPYMRTGLVIGMAGKIKSNYKTTILETIEREGEYTGGISLGFAGALGADFKLNNNIGIFAEIGIITQSWAPKKSEITKLTINGQDRLDDLTTNDREIEYVDSYTFYFENTDMDSPSQELKTYFPFSSVGGNVGIRFTFGVKSEIKE
jgi:hypothetical protein